MSTESGSGEQQRVLEQQVANQIITGCNAALKVFRIHASENQAVMQPLRMLTAGLELLSSQQPRLMLACVEGIFYLGDTRVRMSTAQQQVADNLAQQLKERAIGGIRFEGVPSEQELSSFFKILSATRSPTNDSNAAIRSELKNAQINNIGISKVLCAVTENSEERKPATSAAGAFAAAITHATQLSSRPARVNGSRSKRIVHQLVDLAEEDGYLLTALAGMRGVAEDDVEHNVSVTILAIALGKRLGLPKAVLADLGVAALHHDRGLDSLGNSKGSDTTLHPLVALKSVAHATSLDLRLLREVIVCFEHHADYKSDAKSADPPHLLSQIVRLANEFDALTRGRRSKRPLTVLDALENMRSHRGTTYQRALFDVFEQLVGGVTEEEQQEADSASDKRELDSMLAAFLDRPDAKAANPKSSPSKSLPRRSKRGATLGALKLKSIAVRRSPKSR